MKKAIFSCTLFFLGLMAFSQPTVNLWEDTELEKIALLREVPLPAPARVYRTLRLDFARAATLLHRAPLETANKKGIPFYLPLPDGGMEAFLILESPLLEPALARKYPQLKTFLAQGIDRPELTARMDITPFGLHASVFSPGGTFYIDPVSEGLNQYYFAYYTRHVVLPEGSTVPRCGISEQPVPLESPSYTPTPFGTSTLRDGKAQPVTLLTYRLALACTGEYAQAKGGNKLAVMASMLSSINRVNQIFEKETAIRLHLIAQNDTLIFLDPDTDPYTNIDLAPSLLNQNTGVLNQILGANAYDLGHVFTLACKNSIAGIAAKSATCGPYKGAGVTCHFTSNTEFIAVQVMAHELGHQFSCGHSWNHCEGFNSAIDTDEAFEPGSGSTIMSYASACGSDNISNASDSYYHVGSLEDFYAFTRQFQGKNCATPVPTANSIPTLQLDYPTSFYIPALTPFQLKAQASDPDGDPLTYCWEQYDSGPSVPLGDAQLNAPLFRSFPPTASNTRIFPQLSTLLRNEKDVREILPSYSRKLTFRCTVRDNAPGAAGVTWGQVQFQVAGQAGPFVVTQPNSTDTIWRAGTVQTISWEVANTQLAPVNCKHVHIRLSVDGGLTYPYLLAENAPNNGTARVAIPPVATIKARVLIEAADNIFFDISDKDFSIAPAEQAGYAMAVQPYAVPLHCQPEPLTFTVHTYSLQGYQEPIALTLDGALPPGASYGFSPNPVRAGSPSTLQISLPSGSFDTLSVGVRASSTGNPAVSQTIRFSSLSNSFDSLYTTFPANGAAGIILSTPLTWNPVSNASSYNLELSPSPAFGKTNIFSKEKIIGSTWIPNVLLRNNTLYYWRIQPNNACGSAPFLDPSTFHTATTSCKTYQSANVPLNIPGAGTPVIESRITVNETGVLNDVNIPLLRINKEYVRNLRISLLSPKGTEVILYNGHCALTSKLYLGFDDEAPQAVNGSGVCPPDDGIVFRPTDSLSRFKGENIQGIWILRIAILKNESLSPGALESWNLEFCSAFEAPQPILSRNKNLLVPPGGHNTLTSSQLLAEDKQSTASALTFTLVRTPAHGQLKSGNTVLATGDSFTQAQINAFQIQYQHGGGSDTSDTFLFVVENSVGGYIPPQTFHILLDANAVVGTTSAEPTYTGFRLFPNPATERLILQWEQPEAPRSSLRLFNVQGQLVLQQQLSAGASFEIDISHLTPGMYLAEVQHGQGIFREKLFIQR